MTGADILCSIYLLFDGRLQHRLWTLRPDHFYHNCTVGVCYQAETSDVIVNGEIDSVILVFSTVICKPLSGLKGFLHCIYKYT